MTWQGIPFRLIEQKSTDYISIALSSVPKISLDSPPDYTGPAITALAALIGGLIPSIIAWRTFKRNAEHTRRERISQQDFLRRERAAQQQFLKEERAAQNAALELDRQVQLRIASQNFNMQVLSANRQAWINEIRDKSSELISKINLLILLNDEYHKINLEQTSPGNYKRGQEKDLRLVREKLTEQISLFTLLVVKIELMLNADEEISIDIMSSIVKLRKLSDDVAYYSAATCLKDIDSEIKIFKKLIKTLLKSEWVRVKEGR